MNIKRINIKVFSFCLIMSLFLHQYSSVIPGITLGEFLLIISGVSVVLDSGFSISLNKTLPLIKFYLVCMLFTLFSFLIQQHDFVVASRLVVFSRWTRSFAYVAFIVIGAEKINVKYALKIYKFLCVFLSLYIILQTVSYFILNYVLPINFLPFSFSREIDVSILSAIFQSTYFRAYGFFVEPGYAVKFLLPGLAIFLYKSLDHHRNMWMVVLITTSLILTTSLQGIIFFIFTIFFFYVRLLFSSKAYKNLMIFHISFIFIIIILLILILSGTALLKVPVQRISSILHLSQGHPADNLSTGMRLFRGFFIFDNISPFYKTIGVGLGNIGNFILKNNISNRFDSLFTTSLQLEYVNGISGILIQSGFVGFVLFLNYIFFLYKHVNDEFKLILFQYILIFFVDDSFFSMVSVFYLSLIYIGFIAPHKKGSSYKKINDRIVVLEGDL